MSANDLVKEHIRRLKPYVPGKPIEEVEREFGVKDIVKLASNENPLGPSPKAISAMANVLDKVNLYPDGSCYHLKKSLASHLKVKEDQVIIGNGSDEIIHYIGITFLSQGDQVIQADPSFVRYESAACLSDCECVMVPLKDYVHDLDAIADRITDKTRLIFVANPNNPTGTAVNAQEVERFISRLPERVIAVFDEAYYEYVEMPDFPDMLQYVRDGANVIVLRTFSKIYGLAGLRVGYGVARPEIIQCLNQVREPFNVNSLAQVAAVAALTDTEHVERSRQVNAQGKRYLYGALDSMGLPYVPTEANFIWVDLKTDCRRVFTELLKKGVIIRTCDIFGYPTCVRVTIGTELENQRFINALEEVLAY